MEFLKWRLLPLLSLVASIAFFYIINHPKPSHDECSLLAHDHFWISSKRIVTPKGVISGAVEVKRGKIVSVIEENWQGNTRIEHVIDYGEAVVMPGLIDVHSHLDDPGRAEWEGFPSGTRAAAAGGLTTLIDMPLNSFPSTVSKETFELKLKAAAKRIHVDVGFWGGLVPENAFNRSALEGLLKAGVLGLKSFMCPSGINDFPMTNANHIKEGLSVLAKYRRPLLVHAEIEQELEGNSELEDSRSYSTYLKTRPASWEEAAVRELLTVTNGTRTGGPAEGAHLHIVHLSNARSSLDLIKEAKRSGDSITVETCPHYLAFSAEEIQDGDTRFKCAPPIRDSANREQLWEALVGGKIDMLSSDHSPTVPELKCLNDGNFLKAWGGISSLQFVLPVTWSYGRKYGISLEQLASWWSEKPAKLAGLDLKGAIEIGNYADIAVWEPEAEFDLNDSHPIYIKHPSISAYMGSRLSGKVLATYVRGNLVYKDGEHSTAACGVPILAS
ncbi:Allantoinase [Actinidia chinensis var. chinensis]|uniref:allantoinase n=1 Tax=Actinidia chinensis var. chinensis TaxID=1590841 RepID=A0A2R6QA58_ACTCC|nr:Allantoinase [Actinidia chinensis var. chinensis]